MIVDHRTYTLVPRKMAKYLELFEAHALPVCRAHGFELMGYYTSQIGTLNQVVHLWCYRSLADLEAKRAARDADPAWGRYLALTEGLVLAQQNQIMKPASFSPDA
ncbi:MAG: NIPSNAP family protein [Proteobacteria bacterium]|nr:NIPSNAP family protein [Pseudomonadota bacterium]